METLRASKDENIVFLLEQLDLADGKRHSLAKMTQELRIQTQYYKGRFDFIKRELDQLFKAVHEVVFLDQRDGRFAEIIQEAQRAYEERASGDESF